MIQQSKIREIVQTIVAEFQPRRIILFGSQATGKASRDSDLDLLILTERDVSPLALSRAIRRRVAHFGVPVDILVKSMEEFEQFKSVIGTISYPADKFGKVLYDSKRRNMGRRKAMDR